MITNVSAYLLVFNDRSNYQSTQILEFTCGIGVQLLQSSLLRGTNSDAFVSPPPPPPGRIRREGASEAAPEAVGQAVGGGCRSGWGRLLSVRNATEGVGWGPQGGGGEPPPPPPMQPCPQSPRQWCRSVKKSPDHSYPNRTHGVNPSLLLLKGVGFQIPSPIHMRPIKDQCPPSCFRQRCPPRSWHSEARRLIRKINSSLSV